MSKHVESVGFLYVNGLGSGKTKLHERLAMWWWNRRGIDLQHAHVNWFDGQDLDAKVAALEVQVKQMLEQFGKVAIIGSSAGGSLAISTFTKLNNSNVYAVAAHARLQVGDYPNSSRKSLFYRAHMQSSRPLQAFFDSVTGVENQTVPNLTDAQKSRLLTLSSAYDGIVPPKLMTIDGVQNHRAFAFGHAGGFLTHMLVDRDLVIDFVESRQNI